MSTLTIPNTFSAGTKASANQVNANFQAVATVINGQLDDSNLAAGAGIALSKLNRTNELLIARAANNACLSAAVTGDVIPRATLTSSGLLSFGAGSSSSQDMALKREDANTLSVRDAGDTTYKNLKTAALNATTLTLSSSLTGTSGTFSGALAAASLSLTSPLTTANGGTGLSAFTTGDLLYCSATNTLSRLPIGSNGQTLQVVAGVPAWTSGTQTFISSDQTITQAGALTIAHSLSAAPKNVWMKLICQTAEAGYSVGDEIVLSPASGSTGCYIVVDSTNLIVRFYNSASVFGVFNKSSGSAAALTNSSWKVRFYAQ